MTIFTDFLDFEVSVGDIVGVAFGGRTSAAARLRAGEVLTLEPEFTVRWIDTGKVSNPMLYSKRRIVRSQHARTL